MKNCFEIIIKGENFVILKNNEEIGTAFFYEGRPMVDVCWKIRKKDKIFTYDFHNYLEAMVNFNITSFTYEGEWLRDDPINEIIDLLPY